MSVSVWAGVAYSVSSRFLPPRAKAFPQLQPKLQALYEHAELPGDWAELAYGHAERLIGAELRVLPATDPRWRRVWAAWSATRAARKRFLPLEQQEQYALEWVEWGMRQ